MGLFTNEKGHYYTKGDYIRGRMLLNYTHCTFKRHIKALMVVVTTYLAELFHSPKFVWGTNSYIVFISYIMSIGTTLITGEHIRITIHKWV